MNIRRFAFLASAVLLANAVGAQDYPRKPVRLIVPFAAGGGNDTIARAIAQQLSAGFAQQVYVDNRAGAGGVVGAELAAKAPADGYTLFLGGVGSHAVNPNLHAKLPYDPIKDFAPITLIASAPSVLVVHLSVPANTIKEFVALAKARPENSITPPTATAARRISRPSCTSPWPAWTWCTFPTRGSPRRSLISSPARSS